MISLGDNDSGVLWLRQTLIEQGFDCGEGTPDEIFGPAMESAVKLFQACHVGPTGKPLDVDGIVGARTRWALGHASGAAQHRPPDDVPIQAASNPIAVAALREALGELAAGVCEVPDGSNRSPRVDLYTGMSDNPTLFRGPPWCAYFISWCHASAPGGSPFGRIGGAQSIALWCLKHIPDSVTDVRSKLLNNKSYVPKCGDIGVIANDQVHGHCVLVRATLKGNIWTVEGNCGNAVRSLKRFVASFRWFVNFDAYAKSKGLA